jgi:hypothetical protein
LEVETLSVKDYSLFHKEAKGFCKENKHNEDYYFLIDLSIHSSKSRFFIYDFEAMVLHSWSAVKNKEVFPKYSPLSWVCPAISNEFMKKLDSRLRNSESQFCCGL